MRKCTSWINGILRAFREKRYIELNIYEQKSCVNVQLCTRIRLNDVKNNLLFTLENMI